MTKIFLFASVAALAIAAPAQAERGEKGERGAKAERSERAPPPKAQRAERPQRAERAQMQRAERPQMQLAQRAERPAMQQRARVERPQRQERIRLAQPQREPRRVRIERPEREQRVAKVQNRVERRATKVENRVERQAPRRIERREAPRIERVATQTVRREQRQAGQLAKLQDRREQRLATQDFRRDLRLDRKEDRVERKLASAVGKRFDTQRVKRDWYDDVAARRAASFISPTPDYFYDYDDDDGYLYQVRRDNGRVSALYPLLGGAFSTGRVLPIGFQDYNVPYAYRSLYYDTPDYAYRFGDGGIYRVDPDTQLISAVVALLTGQNLGVGQMLPMGYDVYNVPYAYRDTFYDSNDAWYRYDDGYIYQVDPYSRRIEGMYPVSYGQYAVGYPAPSYASYGGYGAYAGYPSYAVPYDYQQLYYGAPGYNYHYANNGIYQVDPTTQLVSALVALVTGTNLGVGQMLPAGYDAYNVPYQYRSTYFDTDDSWYRYDDGMIYEVDPYSRVIQAAIPLSYDGYVVGQPIPAAYPGYSVPDLYSGLYDPVDGYDYRYFDGGIYQVQPDTRVVLAPVALVTGHTLAVGQPLPMGYDVYNVPYAYRDRYYDNGDNLYRYADGRIYQVDPQTRLIRAVIDAIV